MTEFGSSTKGKTSFEGAAGTALTTMMLDMKANNAPTATTTGVTLATIYELYGPDSEAYYLRRPDRTIAPQGAAVKTWIAANGNPSK